MNSAFTDWQSWAALLVVAGTAAIFLRRTFGKRKKAGGCASCGSAQRPEVKVAGKS